MKIKKENILSKTNYGLDIYAYILRCYYPGEEVLSLSGLQCQPARNPYNKDRPTLLIEIVDGCAVHTDSESAVSPGNVFDLAASHFKLEGEELFNKLNDELHLHIGQEKNIYEHPEKINTSIQIPAFSFFQRPVMNTIPQKEINLVDIYRLIRGNNFALSTNILRSLKDHKQARKYKARNFDYATFSGTFTRRCDKALKKHSGLLAIDFDHIRNIKKLKKILLKDPYFETELLFVSPSGDGLKWIIPMDLKRAIHRDYFQAVANYIQEVYQLEVDQSGKDVSRACFIPHDPDVYIHPKYIELRLEY